jgi:hypothetical protein
MKHCMVTENPSASRDEIVDEAIKVFLKYSACMG